MIAGTPHAGVEVFAIDAILALRERDVGQFVLCRSHDNFLKPFCCAGIPVETFDFNKWTKWFARRRVPREVRRVVRSHAPDVVHAWGGSSAGFLPSRVGVPSLGWDVSPNARKIYTIFDYYKYYGFCDYYMGVNPGIIERLKEQTGRPDCVFLGHTFGTLEDDMPLSREEFGIPADKPVILMLARMFPKKGVDILLCAACEVDAFLLLAGDGPDLESYKKLARDLGIDSRVCFAGWRTDRAALLELADALAIPSRQESFARVMPEAWSKGVPVVATRADGPRKYIKHGVNGMLSDIDDVAGLTQNLRRVLEDTTLREKLIEGGKHTYETQFTKGVVIDNLLKTYREIIRRGPTL